ncbi:TolC family protein [Psychrobium sp. 1_MG-2023]|uniref:TolC family protein n=1 Tax=Psychrobium sp. 1_MG-2023 TaxID=3062624 RepID=UPI000C333D62|nr:TolC family protein [Psychrobium sp. 1_MG-2023]MDP2559704.1 TolC family protein [Psychrobium sp. 1_MG-2023]PKF59534.1 hypothetical protein CW748_01815 [Alteromonadales bacterium alter-6D02]
MNLLFRIKTLCAGFIITASVVFASVLGTIAPAAATELTLDAALKKALADDLWLKANAQQQQAIVALSEVDSTLPDPVMSVGLVNLAADSLAFNQEPMSQLKIGISQKFARGDSLALKRSQRLQQSKTYPLMRQVRQAQITKALSQHWLTLYHNAQAIRLIEQQRPTLEQLISSAERSYGAGLGSVKQSDITAAQLDLLLLDDRVLSYQTNFNALKQQLNSWLPAQALMQPLALEVMHNQPQINASSINWLNQLSQHPEVLVVAQQVDVLKQGVDLAKESEKPQWGVSASYGYRNSAPNGSSRADLFSVGLSVDLPIFSRDKQRQQVNAAQARVASKGTERLLLIQQLSARAHSTLAKKQQLMKRQQIFSQTIVGKNRLQHQAALTNYGNDLGQLSSILRSQLALINAHLTLLAISVELQQLDIELNYLLTSVKP